ncbi:hypothetical protein HID58_082197 [Brassica napus]|uniref:DUF7903 domain-containing protein n=1 Tax=Brassica napus TaxID=3708 RepID=A0ABQ7YCM8_BRANA|nr:hypothetical protein HID58_082197 [Brassica napus]
MAIMSYVPQHKRHENVALRASSAPPSLLTKHKNTKIIYANDFISRWFVVGSEDNNSFQLVPVSLGWRRESEDKPLVMLAKSESGKLEDPWLWIAEKVENDLMLGFGRAKGTLLRYASDDVNLRLITRFGKAVFNGLVIADKPCVVGLVSAHSSDSLRDDNVTKRVLGKLKRSFRTNVPKSYVENTVYGVVPKMGFSVEETKELYHVKVVFDNTRPDITISCKCMAELNALRHLIIDVSCLDQDLDMRLSENEIKNLAQRTDRFSSDRSKC